MPSYEDFAARHKACSWMEFVDWEKSSRDTIDVKRCYVDVAGDLVTGVVLSQIVYWYLPGKRNRMRLTVERNGELWLAKKRHEWWHECRVTAKQADRALKSLENKRLLESDVFHFHHIRTKHVRLIIPHFLDALARVISPVPWKSNKSDLGRNILYLAERENVPPSLAAGGANYPTLVNSETWEGEE